MMTCWTTPVPPALDRLTPEYQHLQVGDWMPMAKITGTTAFKATAFGTSRWLLWQNRTVHGPEADPPR
jgi:hypothetical protein